MNIFYISFQFMNDYKMSSQKSGAQKRKEKQKRDEINKKGRQTLFQFGVKCKTSETNQNETLNLEQCETSAELKQRSESHEASLDFQETSDQVNSQF